MFASPTSTPIFARACLALSACPPISSHIACVSSNSTTILAAASLTALSLSVSPRARRAVDLSSSVLPSTITSSALSNSVFIAVNAVAKSPLLSVWLAISATSAFASPISVATAVKAVPIEVLKLEDIVD